MARLRADNAGQKPAGNEVRMKSNYYEESFGPAPKAKPKHKPKQKPAAKVMRPISDWPRQATPAPPDLFSPYINVGPEPTRPRPSPATGRKSTSGRATMADIQRGNAGNRARGVMAQALSKPDKDTYALISQIHDPGSNHVELAQQALRLMGRSGVAGANSTIHLLATGVPLASVPENIRKNAAKILKDYSLKGVSLDKVPRVNVLDPGERDQLRAVLKQKGTDPGEHATDTELLIAAKKHKLGPLDIIKNIPASGANALLGVPVGGYQTGRALGSLAFGKHDAEPLKAMGSGLVAYYKNIKEHPVRALESDPVGTVSALMPAKTLLGGSASVAARAGLAGKAAKAFATAERTNLSLPAVRTVEGAAPQQLLAAGFNPLRSNLIDRSVQRGLEKVTERAAPVQNYRLKKQAIREQATATAETYALRDAMLQGLQEARRGASKEERRAILAYAQGETPSRLAAYYRKLIQDEPSSRWNKPREAQARIWDKVAKKTGDSPTPRVEAYLEELKIPLAKREEIMTRIGKVPEEQIAARRGIVADETQSVLGTRSPIADSAQYVPHVDTAVQYGNFLVRRGLNPEKKLKPSANSNNLVLMRRGTWQADHRILEASLAQASNVDQMRSSLERTFSQYGRIGKPGEAYEGTLFRIPASGERRVMHPAEAGPALSDTLKEMYNRSDGASEADLIDELRQKLIVKRRDQTIPDDGATYIVMPEPVAKQIRGEFGQHHRGAVLRAASTGTDAWRYLTLFARPAWLTANALSNPFQSAIGMAESPYHAAKIPLAYARAMGGRRIPGTGGRIPELRLPGRDYSAAMPQGLLEAGWFNDLTKIQHAGSNADTGVGRFIGNIANTSEVRAIRKYAGAGPRAIVNTNKTLENIVRTATYLHGAVPAAKKAANGTRWSRVTDQVMHHLENNEMPKAAELVRDTLGDMRRKNRPNARLIAPFYRWLNFASHLALVTLPVKMPIRNELIQAMGREGMNQITQLGGIPDYLKGAVAFDPETRTADDGSQHQFAKMLATRNVNTLATPAEFLKTNDQGLPTVAGALSYLNPGISAIASTMFGRDLETGYAMKDENGNDLNTREGYDTVFKTMVNQGLRTLPLVNMFDDPSGKAANTLPFRSGKAQDKTGLQQPKRSLKAKVATYLTGVNVREADLTLYNVQWMYHFLDPSYNKEIPPELEKQIRKRLNRLQGKSGPYYRGQLRDKKLKEQGAAAVNVTVPTYTQPSYSQPTYETPTYSAP